MKKIKLAKHWFEEYCTDNKECEDYLLDSESESLDLYIKENKKSAARGDIGFDMRTLPHCCGIIELGELRKLNPKELFQEDFDNLMGFLVTNRKQTIIINTLLKGDSATWNSYLEASPYFDKVKSFKNPNSGNTINVWISK